MKITYTGRHDEFPPKQRARFELKLQKLSKLLEHKGEKEAHVVLTHQRFLHKVEVTVNAYDHALVGMASDADVAAAMHGALDKLEKQVVKLRSKWRDSKRHKDKGPATEETAAPVAATGRKRANTAGRKHVFRVNHENGRKPMTAEEAMLEMDPGQDYVVYRDAQTDRVSVLLRRPDGHFDLIES